jgi:hypothetical protein
MNAVKSVEVPVLSIDAKRNLGKGAHTARRIAANMIDHLAQKGWTVASVFDGDIHEEVGDAKAAMEIVFDVGVADVSFKNAAGAMHGVRLVPSNGVDILTNWSFADNDADGFGAVMDEFDPLSFE